MEGKHQSQNDDEEWFFACPLSLLTLGRMSLRLSYCRDHVEEVALAIREAGKVELPLVVRPTVEGQYEVVVGEYRYRAAKQEGLASVPVIVRSMSDKQAVLASLADKSATPLSPIEEALSFKRLIDDFGMTHEQVANSSHKAGNRTYVTKAVRLLSLPKNVIDAIHVRKLSPTHGHVLLHAKEEARELLAEQAMRCHWDTRHLQKEVERVNNAIHPLVAAKREPVVDKKFLSSLEKQCRSLVGCPIKIKNTGKPGRQYHVRLTFKDMSELNEFFNQFTENTGDVS